MTKLPKDLDFEFKSIEDIKSVQDQLLSEAIEYAASYSPYYKKLFKQQAINPKEIQDVADLPCIPLTDKKVLRERNWDFLAVDKVHICEILSTTGTTGLPIFMAMTENDLTRLGFNEQRSFSCANTTKEDTFQLAVTMDNLFIAGLAYYLGITGLGAKVIRVGPHSPQRQLELMKDLGTTGIVAIPSFMLLLYKEACRLGLKPSELPLKKSMLIGESIRNPDLSSNALGRSIEDQWHIDCYSTYGNTEGAISFCECQGHCGLHEHSDLIISEIIDPEGNLLPDGEIGELVITTLGVEGMPLIRYQTGDITFKISTPCNCGRNSVRLGPILGRKDHKLKIKGTTVYPQNIINALYEIPEIENYVLEVYQGDDFADHLTVKVGTIHKHVKLIESIQDIIKAKARVTPQIIVMSPEEIKAIQFEGNRRKPRTFIDHRDQNAF